MSIMTISPRPLVLIILDGFGYREVTQYNAVYAAHTLIFNELWEKYPHTLLGASGEDVGLPDGQMGNSEVGHLNIGAGRVVYQEFTRISKAIKEGDFFKNPVFVRAIDEAIADDKALHIFGLLSPGGIHSHQEHIFALCKLAAEKKLKKLYLHAFLDGRDTPPKSAENYIQALENHLKNNGVGKIISLNGRYYGMDRDKRWERLEKAYNLFTLGEAEYHAEDAISGLNKAYAAGETDEFVKPVSIHAKDQKPMMIEDGDSIIFMNFRADRAREITAAFTENNFNGFARRKIINLKHYICLTEYDATLKNVEVAYPPQSLANTLGEYLAKNNKTQLRIAETEKYAHVTFFFNGGVEAPNKNEDRMLIPSPKVATYDLQPEMNAPQVTEKLVEAIKSQKYDAIVCNYANPDMVGHTGDFNATVKALTCLNQCLKQVLEAIKSVGGEAIITADHGNAELMFDEKTHQPHTAHTCNPVPFIYIGRPAKIVNAHPALCDLAPTLLYLMQLPIPSEMTGKAIINLI